ncbi:DUF6970 domain-containing protein [Spirosoma soli]|uniref:DUF6970 domain-containing protein n=1 Tax=Spirosoma soli TaxID=1770529 RepID=A0ABW5M2W4_9BACT
MKLSIRCLAFICLLGFGCDNDPIPRETPDCIRDRINQIKSQDKWNPPAKVFRYSYKGQPVYYIPSRCCDIPGIVLDAQCNVVCAPDGGLGGSGDGTCTDFFKSRTDEQLIWQDSRK